MAKLIENRKGAHIDICTKAEVEYCKSAGFGDIDFIHNALPDLSPEEIDTSCLLFNKKLSAPIFLEPITGGYGKAREINRKLAAAAEKAGVAFFLGSQRAMIENPSLASTYKVRDVAPTALIFGNIGIAQLKPENFHKIESAIETVGADGLAVHLNALQEALQPEGNRDFKHSLHNLERACRHFKFPVVVKETGAGISRGIAHMLAARGVRLVDVAGAGGTSWSKVEYARGNAVPGFDEWGIPTVQCIAECASVMPTAASGGVRSGIDVAKSLALGADYAGAALPFLRAQSPLAEIEKWKSQLRTVMFLTGCRSLRELRHTRILITGQSAELMRLRHVDPGQYARR